MEGLALAQKIEAKAESVLAPLDREMLIMKWPADYQAIMWEAVMLKVIARLQKCKS